MNAIKLFTSILAISCTGCAQVNPVKSSEYLTLDVTMMRVIPNAVVMHMENGETSAEDIAEVKVNSVGPYLNVTLPISMPALDTASYNRFIEAVPSRKETWALLRSPNRSLVLQVKRSVLEDYLKLKDDESRVLPSISVFELHDVRAKPTDSG